MSPATCGRKTLFSWGRCRLVLACAVVLLALQLQTRADDMAVASRLDALKTTTTRPRFSQLQELEDISPKAILIAVTEERDLVRQRGAIWALANVGEREASRCLRDVVSRDYSNRVLSQAEERTLLDAVIVLGIVSRDDDESFQFILDRLDPKAWLRTRRWKSSRGADIDRMLTGFAIQAVGISGSPKTEQVLGRLQEQPAKYLHEFAGDIAQARFYAYMRNRYGYVGLTKYLCDGDDTKSEFQKWINGEGRLTLEWANRSMRGPEPSD